MPINAPVRDYLKTRRSVGIGFLKDPGPTPDELREILTIGTRVPDHGKFEPWRLILIEGDARLKAGEKLAEIQKRVRSAMKEFYANGLLEEPTLTFQELRPSPDLMSDIVKVCAQLPALSCA